MARRRDALGPDDFDGVKAGGRHRAARSAGCSSSIRFREVALVYAPRPRGRLGRDRRKDHRPLRAACDSASRPSTATTTRRRPRSTRHKQRRDTQYAAFYAPWIRIADPQSGAPRPCRLAATCSASTRARTSSAASSRRPPTRSCAAPSCCASHQRQAQDILNPRGVNAIRRFPGRGSASGARGRSRPRPLEIRLVCDGFSSSSNARSTRARSGSSSSPMTTASGRASSTRFVSSCASSGARRTLRPHEKEAFFITCDRTTMSQDDILNGRLICEIGIAPVRPAEFVIFRIGRWTVEAKPY